MSRFYYSVEQYGNRMQVRSFEDGKRQKYEVKYRPYLFLNSQEDSEYKTIHGKPVKKIRFDDIRSAKDFIKKYEDVNNFEFYGMTDFVYPFINDTFPGVVEFDPDLIHVVSFDIETDSEDGWPNIDQADKEINAITLSLNSKEYLFLSFKKFVPHRDNVKWVSCKDERDLLINFVLTIEQMDPDIFTGWNIESFDIPYIINRIRRVLGDEWAQRLSPWKRIREVTRFKKNGQEYKTYVIAGIACMDYMLIYQKWSFKTQESYSLDNIASVELGLGKVDYSEYGSLNELYKKNFQLYGEYNIRDTEIINQLEDKLKLMDLVLTIAYDAKLNYADAYTSVKMWDVISHNHLIDNKIVVPQYKHSGREFEFVGGYVKEPIPGSYDWVCSFDLNSLYPHLIMQYNISPEMYYGKIDLGSRDIEKLMHGIFDPSTKANADLLKNLKKGNMTVTPNGCLWKKDAQGFLPFLMEKYYEDRKLYKKKMLEAQQKYQDTGDKEYEKLANRYDKIQMSKKITLNSAYGALGNVWFRWFNPDYAESVTTGGQLSIRWIERHLNEFVNKKLKTVGKDYIIASDTDSIYIHMNDIVKSAYDTLPDITTIVEFLDTVCEKVFEPFIDQKYSELAVSVNAFSQKMKMKREAIASRGIWTGKKHYILNVYNNEGVSYTKPKLKMMGIEAVRSSTPASCRIKIKEALEIIMDKTEDDLIEFVANFKEEFYSMPFEKVAFPRGCNGIAKYSDGDNWKSGTPLQVRAAIVFNKLLKERNLSKKVVPLRDGDKIKFSYLKLPNPAKENVIAAPSELPEQLKDLEQYIDYAQQFDKAFESPLKNITDVIGWKLKRVATLDQFFV